MSNPTRAQLHTDQVLTNISIGYQQDPNDFIADQVSPRVPVIKQSDKYYIYDIGDAYRSESARRAPGTESKGTGWRTSTDTYFCDNFSLHQDVTDQDRQNTDTPLDLERDATMHVTQDLLIRKEIEWAAVHFVSSTWTGSSTAGDITPGNLWDVVASTPIEDIRVQSTSVKKKTGYRPNTLVLGIDVFDALVDHADIIDRLKYTQAATDANVKQIMASLFNVDRILVSEAVQNTAEEVATDSMSFIVGTNDALLMYVAPNPGIRVPTASYQFSWSVNGNNSFGTRVSKFRMDELESDRIEVSAAYDFKRIDVNLAAYFLNVVS